MKTSVRKSKSIYPPDSHIASWRLHQYRVKESVRTRCDKRVSLAMRLLKTVAVETEDGGLSIRINGVVGVLDPRGSDLDANAVIGLYLREGHIDYRDLLACCLQYADDQMARPNIPPSDVNRWGERGHAIDGCIKALEKM